jgi:hypothetical protein
VEVEERGSGLRTEYLARRSLRFVPVLLFGLLWGSLCFTPSAAAFTIMEFEGELHCETWTMGGGIGNVQGLDRSLAKIAELDKKVAFIEYTQNFYLDPYVSDEFNGSLNFMNNFSVMQVAVGRRWSTVPFPKVFLRPWVGLYATLNFLEDDRDLSVYSGGEDENDGIGVGFATTLGMTMRLGHSLALEVAAKGDYMALFGRLEAGETFADAFMMRGVYLRLLFISK